MHAGPFPTSFYARDAISLARDLIGTRLLRRCGDRVSGGTIVETEAYGGGLDRACHAFGYRRTRRTEPMYGRPGTAYVYLIYGLHHCLNVVCLRRAEPQAVLIRAVRPEFGVNEMARRRGRSPRRGGAPDPQLTDGPGKLCQALSVDLNYNGRPFDGSPLMIQSGNRPSPPVRSTRRVGLGQVGECADFPWRFLWEDE